MRYFAEVEQGLIFWRATVRCDGVDGWRYPTFLAFTRDKAVAKAEAWRRSQVEQAAKRAARKSYVELP